MIEEAAREKGPGRGVSVIIKALNEKEHIEACILSALDATAEVGGEVILADSGSRDGTLEIADGFPITVVQLADTSLRCCGIGPQLGYQEAVGDFLYLLDGDMQLKAGFVVAALARMEADSGLAAVGGLMEEKGGLSAEFRIRRLMQADDRKAGRVSHLSGGGLYRTAAVRSVGYFSNRNLHAFEELELGARLTGAGWSLERLPLVAILHHPHQKSSFQLLRQRWNTRNCYGPGEFIRSSFANPQLRRALHRFKFVYAVPGWWLLVALACCLPLPAAWRAGSAAALFLAPFLLMSIRRKGLENGTYLICSWILGFLGACLGILRPQVDPAAPIERRILQVGPWRTGCPSPPTAVPDATPAKGSTP
jgi:glycosyltransferase involved in cell wall biosynthesis